MQLRLITLVCALVVASTAGAQPVSTFEELQGLIERGADVAVTHGGWRVEGRVLELSPTSLTLVSEGSLLELDAADVTLIRQRWHDPTRDGALKGLAWVAVPLGTWYLKHMEFEMTFTGPGLLAGGGREQLCRVPDRRVCRRPEDGDEGGLPRSAEEATNFCGSTAIEGRPRRSPVGLVVIDAVGLPRRQEVSRESQDRRRRRRARSRGGNGFGAGAEDAGRDGCESGVARCLRRRHGRGLRRLPADHAGGRAVRVADYGRVHDRKSARSASGAAGRRASCRGDRWSDGGWRVGALEGRRRPLHRRRGVPPAGHRLERELHAGHRARRQPRRTKAHDVSGSPPLVLQLDHQGLQPGHRRVRDHVVQPDPHDVVRLRCARAGRRAGSVARRAAVERQRANPALSGSARRSSSEGKRP